MNTIPNTTQTDLERSNATTAMPAPSQAGGLLQDNAAQQGLEELIGKLEPLLAGGRLNRVVDLLSVVADTVDMTDAYMIEKLAKTYEEGIGAAWAVGNAARMASTRVSKMQETPTIIGLLRMAHEPDVRRGLAFLLATVGVLGQQLAHDSIDHTAD